MTFILMLLGLLVILGSVMFVVEVVYDVPFWESAIILIVGMVFGFFLMAIA